MSEKHDTMWGGGIGSPGEYIAQQEAEIERLRATIEYTIGWLRESGSDLERQLADKLQAALTKTYSKA